MANRDSDQSDHSTKGIKMTFNTWLWPHGEVHRKRRGGVAEALARLAVVQAHVAVPQEEAAKGNLPDAMLLVLELELLRVAVREQAVELTVVVLAGLTDRRHGLVLRVMPQLGGGSGRVVVPPLDVGVEHVDAVAVAHQVLTRQVRLGVLDGFVEAAVGLT